MASSFKTSALGGLMGHELDLANAVPQSQPLNERQVPNNAGGYTFQVDDMARLRRFLIIGSEGGTYYVTEQKLTLEAARGVKALLDAGKGAEVVAEIARVSTEGRAPKQGPGVFALALCCRLGDADTKRAAFDALPKVCRTASTLFDFVNYCKAINQEVAESEGRKVGNASWGRAMRHAVASWYLSKRPLQLAYQVTKYGQRGGWSNRDLLRLAHPQPGFIRVQAQRQEAAQAAGELEKVSLASPGDEEADWEVVDGAASVRSAESAPSTQAAAAALDQRVEELQRVFRFVVDDAAPPAAEGDGRVAAYLAAAHRLRKAQALLPPEEPAADAAAQPAAAQPANTAAQLAAEPWPQLSAAAVDAASHEAAEGSAASGEQAVAEAGSGATYAEKARTAASPQQEAAAGQQEAAGVAPMQVAETAQPQQAAATTAATATAGDTMADGQEAAAGKREGADAAEAASAQPASKKRRVEKAKAPVEPIAVEEACELIRRHRFGREHIGDTRLLKGLEVWGALLDVGIPFTALTRNLGRLTSLGAFDEARCSRAADHLTAVTKRFQDPEAMKAARAHPIVLLNGLRVYAAGRGDIGSLTWRPHRDVVAALDAGFYHAFRNVQPTGKRFLLGVDVSGSMEQSCAGMTGLTARDAAAAVAMCLLRTEGQERVTSMAFTTQFSPLNLREDDSLERAVEQARSNAFGGTDCAQPMVYALQKGLKVDCFVVLTDSETWFGDIHPTEALRQYRAKTGIPARLLVLAFSGSYCTIADPEDAGMLDVPGLDAGVPEVMRQFVLGEL